MCPVPSGNLGSARQRSSLTGCAERSNGTGNPESCLGHDGAFVPPKLILEVGRARQVNVMLVRNLSSWTARGAGGQGHFRDEVSDLVRFSGSRELCSHAFRF